MTHGTTGRLGAWLLLAGMLLATWPALVGGAPTPPASPTPCVGGIQTLSATVSSHVAIDCKAVQASTEVTVQSSGHLDIGNSTFTIAHHTLRVLSGGRLTIQNTGVRSANPAVPANAFDIVAEAGSIVSFGRVRFEGLGNLSVRSTAFTATDVTIESFHGAALFVNGGKVDIARLVIRDGPSALVLRGGAVATLTDVKLDSIDVSGIDAQASTAKIRELSMVQVENPLTVAGASLIQLENLTLVQTVQEAALGPGAPKLDLFDAVPTWNPTHVTFSDNSGRVRLATQPRVRVLDADSHEPIPGVRVELRPSPQAAPLQARTTAADGVTSHFRFFHADFNKTTSTASPDPALVLSKDHDGRPAGLAITDLGPGATVDVELAQTDDFEAPLWNQPAASGLIAPLWNGTGVANLTWGTATDPGGSLHAVSHFILYRFPSDATKPPSVAIAYGQNRTEPLLEAGPVGFRVRPVDLVGNEGELSNLVTVRADPEPPAFRLVRTGLAGPDPKWVRSASATLRVEASDNLSGLLSFRELDDDVTGCGGANEATFHEKTFTTEGLKTVHYRACDEATNLRDIAAMVGIDRTPPSALTYRFSPPLPDGARGWYTKPVSLVVDAADDLSGVGVRSYRLKATDPWIPFVTNATITASGSHALSMNVTDKAGNSRFAQASLAIDAIAPTLTVAWVGDAGANGWYKSAVRATLTASDAHSGIDEFGYRTATLPATRTDAVVRFDQEQNGTIRMYAQDNAGNVFETPWRDLRIDVERPIPPLIAVAPPDAARPEYGLDWGRAPPADAMSGLATLEVHRSTDGESFTRIGTIPGTSVRTGATVVPGKTNHFFLRAVDRAGWTADSNTVQIAGQGIVANASSMSAPPSRIKGLYAFSAQPADLGNTTSATFYLDGVLMEADAEPPYEWTMNAAEMRSGPHETRVVVSRADGSTQEETFAFVVRNGYSAYLEDEAPLLVSLAVAGLVGLFLIRRGFRRLKAQEASS